MAEVFAPPATLTAPDSDLISAVRSILETSPEPMTLAKIRARLPSAFRSLTVDALCDHLRRQAAANVLVQYPKYRSPQERFWDRPMSVHLQALLRAALQDKPLSWSELRRKLPDYAKTLAEAVLEEQVAKANLYRHPPLGSRTGPRFGVQPPDAREYLRPELTCIFDRLGQLGFSRAELREKAIELLHEEEWSGPPTSVEASDPLSAATEQSPPKI